MKVATICAARSTEHCAHEAMSTSVVVSLKVKHDTASAAAGSFANRA